MMKTTVPRETTTKPPHKKNAIRWFLLKMTRLASKTLVKEQKLPRKKKSKPSTLLALMYHQYGITTTIWILVTIMYNMYYYTSNVYMDNMYFYTSL